MTEEIYDCKFTPGALKLAGSIEPLREASLLAAEAELGDRLAAFSRSVAATSDVDELVLVIGLALSGLSEEAASSIADVERLTDCLGAELASVVSTAGRPEGSRVSDSDITHLYWMRKFSAKRQIA